MRPADLQQSQCGGQELLGALLGTLSEPGHVAALLISRVRLWHVL